MIHAYIVLSRRSEYRFLVIGFASGLRCGLTSLLVHLKWMPSNIIPVEDLTRSLKYGIKDDDLVAL